MAATDTEVHHSVEDKEMGGEDQGEERQGAGLAKGSRQHHSGGSFSGKGLR